MFRYRLEQSPRASVQASGTPPPTYVVVCRGPHCRENGSLRLRKRLVELVEREPTVQLMGYACFGQCDFGPNVAFFPEGEWYGNLKASEDADRVVRHAVRGAALAAPPLVVPEVDRVEHLRNIAELIATRERDASRARRWWWPFG